MSGRSLKEYWVKRLPVRAAEAVAGEEKMRVWCWEDGCSQTLTQYTRIIFSIILFLFSNFDIGSNQ